MSAVGSWTLSQLRAALCPCVSVLPLWPENPALSGETRRELGELSAASGLSPEVRFTCSPDLCFYSIMQDGTLLYCFLNNSSG